MYKTPLFSKTSMRTVESSEGETIELKVKRLIHNKEPIKDGSPLIYTERSKGVDPAHNIRTDRWELATEAMDKVHRSKLAKKEDVIKKPDDKDAKVIDINKDSGAESTPGKADGTGQSK